MKYFKVTNEILKKDNKGNPTTTDEPKWLRDEISSWKETYGIGGRVTATEDARYSFIISPDDDLMDKSEDDLEELTEEEIIAAIKVNYPDYEDENGVLHTIDFDLLKTNYFGFALNHTGTISTNETWALSDSPHTLTGVITLAQDVVVTVEAGCTIIYDGDRRIDFTAGTSTGSTHFNATGTAAARIRICSLAGSGVTGATNNVTRLSQATMPNNCKLTLKYCTISNMSNGYTLLNQTGTTVVNEYNWWRDNGTNIFIGGASWNINHDIKNCLISKISVATNLSSTSTGTLTLTDCEFDGNNPNDCASGSTSNVSFTDCAMFNYVSFGSGLDPCGSYTFTRCLLENATMPLLSTSPNVTWTDCVKGRSAGSNISIGAGYVGTASASGCDFIFTHDPAQWCVSQGATTNFTMTNCYIAGWRAADRNAYYTGVESTAQTTGNTYITFTSPRTTPNFPMTPTSITESAIGNNTATIAWTVGFRTKHMIKYGTTSGNYTMSIMNDNETWSGYNGFQMTKTPSFTLTNLKKGTTYYYKVYSWAWMRREWIESSEGDFATTDLPAPTFSGITSLTDNANLSATASWSAATGTVTEYAVYVKQDNDTNLFTSTYLKQKVPSTQTTIDLHSYANNTTDFVNGDVIYVGVRAYNETVYETNTATQNVTVTGGVAPTFSGIDTLTDGSLMATASWSAATGTVTGYRIYIKKDNDTNLFTDTYYKCEVPDDQTTVELCSYADNTTNFVAGDLIYVGVRAYNGSVGETNTASQSVTITGNTAPTFAGITGLENAGYGSLLVSWSAGTGTISSYNIYIKIGSAPDFTELPIKVDSTLTEFIISYLSDGTRFQDDNDVYVSVRAENSGTEDTNTEVLNLNPVGAGNVGVIVGDTVAVGLKG